MASTTSFRDALSKNRPAAGGLQSRLGDPSSDFLLSHDVLAASSPPAFPALARAGIGAAPRLFVASLMGDDGRRPGDPNAFRALPDPGPADYVPANFWATSQIFLTEETGRIVQPALLKPGETYCLAAIVGNGGDAGAGRAVAGQRPIEVRCEALAFSTCIAPATPLPPLLNPDSLHADPVHELPHLDKQSRDVAGFHLDVDKVHAALAAALGDADIDLGGLTPQEWLKDSPPSLKVAVSGGEGAPLAPGSTPRLDCRIARRNLAPLELSQTGGRQIVWRNFVVAQVGTGANQISLQHELPGEAFRLYLAIPGHAYQRHVAGGGTLVGFERVRTVAAKPIAEPILLRQSKPGAYLQVAAHETERFLGLSLGLEWIPRHPASWSRLSDISVVHSAADGSVVGGFTLQLRAA